MQTLGEHVDEGEIDSAASEPLFRGRRKGDAILLAWKYARERGDSEVENKLMLEYLAVTDKLPEALIADRRRKPNSMYAALRGLWEWFMERLPRNRH